MRYLTLSCLLAAALIGAARGTEPAATATPAETELPSRSTDPAAAPSDAAEPAATVPATPPAEAETPVPPPPGSPGAMAEKPIIFQPAELVWKPAAESLPPGTQIAVLEGDPSKPGPFTIRIRFPAGAVIQPHWHPSDEHATVLSGKLHIGIGDTFDKAHTTAVDACGFSLMPAGTHHFGWFPEATELQLHGFGPWKVVYLEKPAAVP